MRDNFTVEEERCLREAILGGETPSCPRCLRVLQLTPIGPRLEVAYVRDRVRVQCGACGLKGVVERR